jgi:cell division protease FtsH
MIDEEVRNLVDLAYTRVKQMLSDKIESVKLIAEELLKKEVLFKDDMERLLGKRTYEDPIANEDPFIPDSVLNPNA